MEKEQEPDRPMPRYDDPQSQTGYGFPTTALFTCSLDNTKFQRNDFPKLRISIDGATACCSTLDLLSVSPYRSTSRNAFRRLSSIVPSRMAACVPGSAFPYFPRAQIPFLEDFGAHGLHGAHDSPEHPSLSRHSTVSTNLQSYRSSHISLTGLAETARGTRDANSESDTHTRVSDGVVVAPVISIAHN